MYSAVTGLQYCIKKSLSAEYFLEAFFFVYVKKSLGKKS